MIVIGLVGGIGSGKSFVADHLQALGAARFDADRAGHQVLHFPRVKAALKARWGDVIFDEQGEVSRSELAKFVFAPPPKGPEDLLYLESITHPEIVRLLQQTIEKCHQEQIPLLVIDAALLLKAGWHIHCDEVWYIDAPAEVRWQRVQQRGWNQDHWKNRENSQTPLDLKKRKADRIIVNAGKVEETVAQISQAWQELISSG
ncbi:Dephospho-CoA kinase [Planctomycetales bacterium 10988]|nr:Dephospho-CoA kinase [Planctomycetales bacterium 10988]